MKGYNEILEWLKMKHDLGQWGWEQKDGVFNMNY